MNDHKKIMIIRVWLIQTLLNKAFFVLLFFYKKKLIIIYKNTSVSDRTADELCEYSVSDPSVHINEWMRNIVRITVPYNRVNIILSR